MNPVLTRFFWLAGLMGGGAILLMLFLFNPAHVPIYPICLFHQLTGLNCPGCGSLRAMHQLLHGNISAALHYNALLVSSLPLFGWVGFRLAKEHISGGPALVWRPIWVWLYVIVWIAFGIVRDLPVSSLAILSP